VHGPVPRTLLVGATLALFLVWGNTFLAFEALLVPRTGTAPLDWWGLVVARMVPVGIVAGGWCALVAPRESLALARAHPRRLLVCGLMTVPVYNGFLYHAMQHRVGGPVASVVTTLTPLWLVVFGAGFLGEALTARKAAGLALGLGGLALLASGKPPGEGSSGARVLEAAVAPLAWSVYSALTKPVTRTHSPLVWTYLVLAVGSLTLLPAMPFLGVPDLRPLGAGDVALVLYLALAATIGGNAVWSWLLRHLPASTVGLTVFLNPPITLVSKIGWAAAFPAVVPAVAIAPLEWAGGAVMLAGVALAVVPRKAHLSGTG
jgi:drug/metabolite transporter (DMT)-like permease